ncbi:MAG TPA: hypothetical protein VEA37_07365, partial [Flavobacterium sp.]|nr:hypothetical protein [Flavobacterium sp.]
MELDESGQLKPFTYTDPLDNSIPLEKSEPTLWFHGLEQAVRSNPSEIFLFTMGVTVIPWFYLCQSVNDLYIVRFNSIFAYARELRPDLFGQIPPTLSGAQRVSLTHFWELAYYLDREALAMLTGGYFANEGLVSYFRLEPLVANEAGARDRNVTNLVPRSCERVIEAYYERGISVFGLWTIGGLSASMIREQFGGSLFLIPQRVCLDLYVLESQAVPMITYRPVLAVFNYYLDGSIAKLVGNDLSWSMEELFGLKVQVVRKEYINKLKELENQRDKIDLDQVLFFSIAATHQPWFFSSLILTTARLLLRIYIWYMYSFLPDKKSHTRWKIVMDLFADRGVDIGLGEIKVCVFTFLFWMRANISTFSISSVLDNLNVTAESFFSKLNEDDLGRSVSPKSGLLSLIILTTHLISHGIVVDIPNFVRYYLPNPNWCAVSVGWHRNRSSFALASLADREPILYHLHPAMNLLENLFRFRLRTYFYGSGMEGGEPRDDLRPALNYDAIYNREFDFNSFSSMSEMAVTEPVILRNCSILEEESLPVSVRLSKFFGFRNVYLVACFAQYLTAMNGWWNTVDFFYRLNWQPTISLNNSYFKWYNGGGKEVMRSSCYLNPYVLFNGRIPALLGEPKARIKQFREKFGYDFQNLATPARGAPMAVLFYLDGEPIPLPPESRF